MKKPLLLGLVLMATLSALAQGKVSFQNDSNHYFVLGATAPADTGLGGGVTNTSGNTSTNAPGAIPISPLPSGYTLIAALYMGEDPNNLILQYQSPLATNNWLSPGRMASKPIITTYGADCATSYVRVVVADYISTNLLETEAFSHYFGSSPQFTLVMCGGTIQFPPILPGSIWNSTWAPGNVVINITNTVFPPLILSQPQSISVIAGSNATLNVGASGTQPLTYQWRKDGAAINGATNSTINYASVALSDAGNYNVVISNQTGTAVSSNAALQVLPFGAPSTRVNGALAVGTVQAISPVVTISGGFNNGIIFYTLDGSQPTTDSPVYSGPITLTSNATVQAMSLSSDFTQTSTAPAVTVLVTPVYSLQTSVSGNGTITVLPPNGPYPSNTLVTLTAGGATNWAFDHWTGDLSGTNNPQTLAMNGPRSVGAVFLPTIYPLTVSSPGGGNVTVNGQTIAPNTFYPSGTNVTLAANASNGWSFIQWQGTATGTANPLNLVMNQTNDVQAIFGTVVSRNIGGSGSITMSQSNPVPFGTALTLTAVPAPGYHFVAWSGAVSGTNNPTILIVTNANPVVGAFFGGVKPSFLVSPASQTVVSNPATTVSFVCLAQGSFPLTYQWYKNGSPIAGATTTVLNLSATYSNAALYTLMATNSAGSSNVTASLSVIPPGPPFANVTNGLVLHLKFDGNYSDSSGRGNNATPVGSPSIIAGRIGPGGLEYSSLNGPSGSTNYLTLGNPADLHFGANTNFSVAYWVRIPFFNGAPATNGDLPFLCSATNSFGNRGFAFAPSFDLGGWSYSLNGVVGLYGGDNTINDGNWHHLVHSFDRSGFAVTWLDGVEVDSSFTISAGDLDNAGPINIGQDPTGQYPEIGVHDLDDIGIWRRALNAYEAYAIYYMATNSNNSFDTAGSVSLNIANVAGNIQISWRPGATLGTLLQADNMTGPWTLVGVYVPFYQVSPGAGKKFYRVQF